VDRLSGLAVPDYDRFALVGDAHGGDLPRPKPLDHLLRRSPLRAPDGLGIVLDPARLRENLGEFLLRRGQNDAIEPDRHRSAGCRPLVERQDHAISHASFLPAAVRTG
jgi:hypothetical protein